ASVAATLRKPPSAPYDVVFSDPPYPLTEDQVSADLDSLVEHGWLVPGALVVVERASRSPEPRWPEGFTDTRAKRYGETTLWYAEFSAGNR
ncbi:RsmD family RNA methyltransferase, partial [Nocardioides hankookensis]